MAATLAKVEQARQELAEERSRVASLLEKREKLPFHSSMELTWRMQEDDRAARAENERKDLALRVQKAEDD